MNDETVLSIQMCMQINTHQSSKITHGGAGVLKQVLCECPPVLKIVVYTVESGLVDICFYPSLILGP